MDGPKFQQQHVSDRKLARSQSKPIIVSGIRGDAKVKHEDNRSKSSNRKQHLVTAKVQRVPTCLVDLRNRTEAKGEYSTEYQYVL